MHRRGLGISILAVFASMGGCSSHAAKEPSQPIVIVRPDIRETLADREAGFSRFNAALRATGLDATLSKSFGYTVLAPSDSAFEKLPAEVRDDLMDPENRGYLRSVLLAHIIPGVLSDNDIRTLDAGLPVAGPQIDLTATDEPLRIGNATVIDGDLMASNGVIHVIDRVLIVPPARSYRSHVIE